MDQKSKIIQFIRDRFEESTYRHVKKDLDLDQFTYEEFINLQKQYIDKLSTEGLNDIEKVIYLITGVGLNFLNHRWHRDDEIYEVEDAYGLIIVKNQIVLTRWI
ncbi:MAG TPA: hypothetical protein VLG50_06690 [Candidatus Saccharimonadales bacterium]|nr:hypothetical protein [Candidatus Saccharimonadales bacterium]